MLATESEVKRLLEAGVHFGHRTDKWNPKMKEFIFGPRNGIYIIDLSRTAEQVRKAADFLREAAAKGGHILFVGQKSQLKRWSKSWPSEPSRTTSRVAGWVGP